MLRGVPPQPAASSVASAPAGAAPASRAAGEPAVPATDAKDRFKAFGPYKPIDRVTVASELTPRQREYLAAFMERCGLQMQHIEAVEQIEAKLLGHNALGEVAIGGGDQTNVDGRGRVAANPLDLTTIEKSKQHGLPPGTRLADFVEKHGSAVCSREQPVAGSLSASEASPLVPEQL